MQVSEVPRGPWGGEESIQEMYSLRNMGVEGCLRVASDFSSGSGIFGKATLSLFATLDSIKECLWLLTPCTHPCGQKGP